VISSQFVLVLRWGFDFLCVVPVTATATGQIQLEWLLQMHWATLAIKLAKTPRCEQNWTEWHQSRAEQRYMAAAAMPMPMPLGMCVIALARRYSHHNSRIASVWYGMGLYCSGMGPIKSHLCGATSRCTILSILLIYRSLCVLVYAC